MISSDNPWIADLREVSSDEITNWLAENEIPGRVFPIPPYSNFGYVVNEDRVQVTLYSPDDILLFKLTWM